MSKSTDKTTVSSASSGQATGDSPYHLRISRLTVDKLGVKLYDKASAVVAELVANGYDADAVNVNVRLPLSTQLATKKSGELNDSGHTIEVEDDGHGMSPEEARRFYLLVGTDRRERTEYGSKSRKKKRPVMGRKGIGKLAPFGICRMIEVWSAGGRKTKDGYEVTHFFMNFEDIVKDDDEPVPLKVGEHDGRRHPTSGTRIRLTNFLAKRVPDEETFIRQLASRFTFARSGFNIFVSDTIHPSAQARLVKLEDIAVVDDTKVDISSRPVPFEGGKPLPVSGWLAMAKNPYKNEETAGVRIYARGKIVSLTRDFEQPAGFTGEFTMRSYLVGEVHAEWLDEDKGEDLIRTDRQDIIWDSDYGQALREWGAKLIKEIAKKSAEPRRKRVRDLFLERSDFAKRANERFSDASIAQAAIELAGKFASFAAEDELEDDDYVEALAEFILSVAPHHALIDAFIKFAEQVEKDNVSIENLLNIFDTARIAEIASYGQIALGRVNSIDKLGELIDKSPNEKEFQELLATAPWLIAPSWTVLTQNQALKTFKRNFESYWKKQHKTDIKLAIDHETKQPDFTLVSTEGVLHIVEIKKADHVFNDADLDRLINYAEAFEAFFNDNPEILEKDFPNGWHITLVADDVKIMDRHKNSSFENLLMKEQLVRTTWLELLTRTRKEHAEFLDARDEAAARKAPKGRASKSPSKKK